MSPFSCPHSFTPHNYPPQNHCVLCHAPWMYPHNLPPIYPCIYPLPHTFNDLVYLSGVLLVVLYFLTGYKSPHIVP